MTQGRILLASASPRRRAIMETLGLAFQAIAVDADESQRNGEVPEAYLERVVKAKLQLAEPLRQELGCAAVIVADTTVVLEQTMLAKPINEDENRAMVRALAGRTHHVLTHFAVAVQGGQTHAQTVSTAVTLRSLTEDEVLRYVASGEGSDKAGGYAIQGLGSFAVVRIAGSYSNVVGLPACELVLALRSLGVLERFPSAIAGSLKQRCR